MSEQKKGPHVLDAGNLLEEEVVGANGVIPQIKRRDIDRVPHSETKRYSVIAKQVGAKVEGGRPIDGRLVDEADSLFPFAVQDIKPNLQGNWEAKLHSGSEDKPVLLELFISRI